MQLPKRAVPLRILVVDDNVDGAEMMQTLLELNGHDVTAVQHGAAAIEEALASRPGMALIDLGMPGMDGTKTLGATPRMWRQRARQLYTERLGGEEICSVAAPFVSVVVQARQLLVTRPVSDRGRLGGLSQFGVSG